MFTKARLHLSTLTMFIIIEMCQPKAHALTLPLMVNQLLLPNPLIIYVRNDLVINHPIPGSIEKKLPVDNTYKGIGCYLACYSHDSERSIYPVTKEIFVHGLVRIKGRYDLKGYCRPFDTDVDAIAESNEYAQLCHERLPSCNNIACWPGPDTGGLLF